MSQEEIIKEFEAKKLTYKIFIGFIVAAVLILSIGASIYEIEMTYILIGIAIIAIFVNLFSFTFWTCPNCNKYLGGSLDIKSCESCGISFTRIKEEKENQIVPKIQIKNENYQTAIVEKKYQNKKYIPDYSKYDIYNLVDVYTRIDHKNNYEEIKIVEQQIRYKLNIDPLIDLSEQKIQDQFADILTNNKPLSKQEKEDKELSNGLVKIQLSILFIAVLALLSNKFGYKNEILVNLGIGLMSIVFLIEFINSFYTKEINLGASSILFNRSPILFRVFQFLVILVFVMCFTLLI